MFTFVHSRIFFCSYHSRKQIFFYWQIFVSIIGTFVSIIGTFVEHNKGRCWALEHSIIGKKKSIICMCLMAVNGVTTTTIGFFSVFPQIEGKRQACIERLFPNPVRRTAKTSLPDKNATTTSECSSFIPLHIPASSQPG